MKKIKYIKDDKEVGWGILYEPEDYEFTNRGKWTTSEGDGWEWVGADK